MTTQQEINLLRNELNTQTIFADSLGRELASILNRSKNGKVLKKDEPRVNEIESLLTEKAAWIKKAQARIAAFYRPASLVS